MNNNTNVTPLHTRVVRVARALHAASHGVSCFCNTHTLGRMFCLRSFLTLRHRFPGFSFRLTLSHPSPTTSTTNIGCAPKFIRGMVCRACLGSRSTPRSVRCCVYNPNPVDGTIRGVLSDLNIPHRGLVFSGFNTWGLPWARVDRESISRGERPYNLYILTM